MGCPAWASSYLRPGRDRVGGLVHLHPDTVDGVAGPFEQYLKDVVGEALQRQTEPDTGPVGIAVPPPVLCSYVMAAPAD